jgi:hypothetical protein
MANMKRISAAEARKATEQMKAKKKVKITGSASSKPQVSNSMIKSQPKTTAKSTKGSNTKPFNVKLMTPRELVGGKEPKKPGPIKPGAPRTPASGTKKNMPKTTGAKPTVKKPMPNTTKKAPGKMTPQDAAMKKILEKKYGKIYG